MEVEGGSRSIRFSTAPDELPRLPVGDEEQRAGRTEEEAFHAVLQREIDELDEKRDRRAPLRLFIMLGVALVLFVVQSASFLADEEVLLVAWIILAAYVVLEGYAFMARRFASRVRQRSMEEVRLFRLRQVYEQEMKILLESADEEGVPKELVQRAFRLGLELGLTELMSRPATSWRERSAIQEILRTPDEGSPALFLPQRPRFWFRATQQRRPWRTRLHFADRTGG